MKLITFKIDGTKRIGFIPSAFEQKIFDISDLIGGDSDLVSLMNEPENFRQRLTDLDEQISENESLEKELVDLHAVKLCPPIERP